MSRRKKIVNNFTGIFGRFASKITLGSSKMLTNYKAFNLGCRKSRRTIKTAVNTENPSRK
ncbi:hypothetical protein ACJVDH_14950 [Pedobacter sp. AW1-32]|uniref:hypothetical protein n=1 Tax=Pedobacter sp. AW1-32 TaxID=3383026 RepID=UPI003FEEA606